MEEGLTAEIEPVEVGTSLEVRPRVGRGREIVLDLKVSIRNVRSAGRAGTLPLIGARRAESTVRVRDGETIVLAGLMEEAETRQRRAVPVLGSLPLIGGAFRSRSDVRSETQLAIFVTPHIIHDGSLDEGEGEPRHG